MNYTQLRSAIAKMANMKASDVESVLSAFKTVLTEALLNDEAISWNGFLKAEPKWREAAIKTNPKTGQKQNVPGKHDAKIAFTKTFRANLNEEKNAKKSK